MLGALYRLVLGGPRRSRRRQIGLLLASATGGGGSGFSIPIPPTSSTATLVPYAPNLTAGPTGKDTTRPWTGTVLDGLQCFANNYDQPWRWVPDTATTYNMGSTSPTTFAVADAAGGTAHAAGTVLRYYLVFRNSTIGKETAPQLTGTTPGTSYTMAGTKDAEITWTDPGGEFDKARIYRALQGSDTYHLVAEVTASTATYTDATADSTLRTNEVYTTRYRTTLPPIFYAITEHLYRCWGWTKHEAFLYYSQRGRVDDEFLLDDFPDANILPVGPNDGHGGIRACVPHYDALYVFKQRAAYEVTGEDVVTFESRLMFEDRGALSPRCVVGLEGFMVFLDERGVFLWTPGGEPIVAGSRADLKESPLQPIWERMNLAAADTFFVKHDERKRMLRFHVALDYDPVPLHRINYDYGRNRFVSIDSLVPACAGGRLTDALGVEHEVRVDDYGWAVEENYGQSDGVQAGDNTGTVTGVSGYTLTCSAAAFGTTDATSGVGTPMERYSSAGVVLDANRVASVTGTTVVPLYAPTDTPAIGDTVALGVIPAVVETGDLTFATETKKWIGRLVVEHDTESSGTLKVQSSVNGGTYALLKEMDLTTVVRHIVPCSDRGWTWSLQLSQRYANLGFTVRGVHVSLFLVDTKA